MRIGKSFEEVPLETALENIQEAEKRPSSFVRIGKSSDDTLTNEDEKRASAFVRIGRSAEITEQ